MDEASPVPLDAIDYDEIFRRGGRNHGNEGFALCKCPGCARIYLMEYEVDTMYLDPEDLSKRQDVFDEFSCPTCGHDFDQGPWVGPTAREPFQVAWAELVASGWRWVTKRTREGATRR